jgi:DNA-binding CsgD family transcriptional regulator
MLNQFTDIFDKFDACRNPEDVWQAGLHTFQKFGADWITAATSLVSQPQSPVLRTSVPADLMAGYIAQDMQSIDPWMRHCRVSSMIISIDVEEALRSDKAEPEKKLAGLFETFNLSHVCLVPVYSGQFCGGVVMYSQDAQALDVQLTNDRQIELRLATAIFANAYRPETDLTSSPMRYDFRFDLSPREKETLAWLANGLSTAQIAYRMGVQPVSVSKNLASIRLKLGTTTREQSLVVAIRMGLINP